MLDPHEYAYTGFGSISLLSKISYVNFDCVQTAQGLDRGVKVKGGSSSWGYSPIPSK